MKIKQVFVWNWKTSWISIAGLALVLLGVNLLLIAAFSAAPVDGKTVRISSIDTAMVTMCFVGGLMSFASVLRFGGANGASRRSVFGGTAAFAVTYSAALSLCCGGLQLLFSGSEIIDNSMAFKYIYGAWLAERTAFAENCAWLIWTAVLCLTLFTLGYLMGGIFYRLGKLGKILFAAGVPSFLVVGVPVLALILPRRLVQGAVQLAVDIGTYCARSPMHAGAAALVLATVFLALSWLVMRRAPITPAQGN